MNVNEIILKELDAIPGPEGSPEPMKSDEKRFSVSYGMFKDFTVRLKKSQDFAIVGKYAKKQFASSNHPNKKKAFGNYFYDLNFGSILKTQYVLKIAEPALTAIQAVPDINIMSNVSLQIGKVVQGAIGGLVTAMEGVLGKTEKGKQDNNVPDDSDYIGNKMEELKELAKAASGTDDDLRALGVLFSRYYGSLIRDPKEILEKAKRVAGIKKSSTEEVGKEFEEMVINDPTNPAILNFLSEGLEKPSDEEIQKGTEALNAFKGAKKPGKKEMRGAYFKLIGSLDYHIKTGFKLFKSKQADAIAKLYSQQQENPNLFVTILKQIAKKLNQDPNKVGDPGSASAFLGELKTYIENEKQQGEKAAATDKADQQNKWEERYEEFEFVAGQLEGKVGNRNVKLFYGNAVKLIRLKLPKYKEANNWLDTIESDALDGDGWKEIRKNIAKRKYNELNTLYREFFDIVSPGAFDVGAKVTKKTPGLLKLIEMYSELSGGRSDKKLYELEDEFKKQLEAIKELVEAAKKEAKKKPEEEKEEEETAKREPTSPAPSPSPRGSKSSKDKSFDHLLHEEQLTKILAPYLMERIKNRKPIDQRLINMIKHHKSQKGKTK